MTQLPNILPNIIVNIESIEYNREIVKFLGLISRYLASFKLIIGQLALSIDYQSRSITGGRTATVSNSWAPRIHAEKKKKKTARLECLFGFEVLLTFVGGSVIKRC